MEQEKITEVQFRPPIPSEPKEDWEQEYRRQITEVRQNDSQHIRWLITKIFGDISVCEENRFRSPIFTMSGEGFLMEGGKPISDHMLGFLSVWVKRQEQFYALVEYDTLLDWYERETEMAKAKGECIKVCPNPSQTAEGFVYLCRSKNTHCVKIGWSKRPEKREATLQAQDPEIEMIFAVHTNKWHERALHEYFADRRVRGEWFSLDAEDIAYIRSLEWMTSDEVIRPPEPPAGPQTDCSTQEDPCPL